MVISQGRTNLKKVRFMETEVALVGKKLLLSLPFAPFRVGVRTSILARAIRVAKG